MIKPALRHTHWLPDGRSIETELETRGGQTRIRARLVDTRGFVEEAVRFAFDLLGPTERIPREFQRDPVVQQAVFNPVEELWRHRQRVLRGGRLTG